MNSYLIGWVQYVKMGPYTSEKLYISCGVPQWSALVPKLFNVSMNDIFNVSQALKLILFADVANIF